jgi:hypothetical protein
MKKNNPAKGGVISLGTPKGIRTPVAALKGLSPSPLDDGGTIQQLCSSFKYKLELGYNNVM